MPVVSPKPISVAPASANCSARSSTRSIGTLPSIGAAERGGDDGGAELRPSATTRRPMTSLSAMVSSTVRLMLALLWVWDALTKMVMASKRPPHLQGVVEPLAVGDQDHQLHVVGHVDPVQHLTPSESWGTTSGRTKLATSMRFKPASPRALISSILSRVAMVSGSFWKPSRGPDFPDLDDAVLPRGPVVLARTAPPVSEGPGELLTMLWCRYAYQPARALCHRAAGEHRDAVFGDDDVDVCARVVTTPASQVCADRRLPAGLGAQRDDRPRAGQRGGAG